MRWIAVRRPELASGIGPAIAERLTTGDGAAPIGRAVAGRLVGSPTPRRDERVGSVGSPDAASAPAAPGRADVDSGAGDGAGVAAVAVGEAWRLTLGSAVRVAAGFDGARRMPPDGAGNGAAVAGPPSVAADEWA